MFSGPFGESIIKRAQDKSLVDIEIYQLRDWAKGKHKVVDDRPYGGGVGMLLMVEPIYKAIKDLKEKVPLRQNLGQESKKQKVILLDAGGETFTQAKARNLSKEEHLIFICGRYEGVDHRVREHLIDEEISIGNYVLTGGELPAMVVIDSIVRLIPGVLTKEEATKLESYPTQKENGKWKMENRVEHPQYTRPEDFMGWKVPEVLLSGDHKKIEQWKKMESKIRSENR